MVVQIMRKQVPGEVIREEAVAGEALPAFDYNAAAELFPCHNKKSKRRTIAYRRFGRAADAIRFAVEDLVPEALVGAYLEVDEERYDVGGIRRLYESAEYPSIRRAAR